MFRPVFFCLALASLLVCSTPAEATELSATLRETAQLLEETAQKTSGGAARAANIAELETLYKDCVSLYQDTAGKGQTALEERVAYKRLEAAWQKLQDAQNKPSTSASPTPREEAPSSPEPGEPGHAPASSSAALREMVAAGGESSKMAEEYMANFLMAAERSLNNLRRAISEDAVAMTEQFKKAEERKIKPEDAGETILPKARHFLARGYRRSLAAQTITREVAAQCKKCGVDSHALRKQLEKMMAHANKIDNTIKNAALLYTYYSNKIQPGAR